MSTATWKTRISLTLVAGLFALAGAFSNGLPASAQEACPLPAGVTAPADPTVTAQQVADNSATLMDSRSPSESDPENIPSRPRPSKKGSISDAQSGRTMESGVPVTSTS